ncbi:MAG: hypothetical protein ACR2J4_05115 [Deinococcus sp.]
MNRGLLSVTLSLALVTGLSPARAAGSPAQLGAVWPFVQQLQGWVKSLSDLGALKDGLFGDVNYQDVGQQLLGRALDAGLKSAGIDVKAYLSRAVDFQAKVNELRGQVLGQARGVVRLAFLDPSERAFGMQGSLALNPGLAQDRFQAARTIARATQAISENTQTVADGVRLVEDAKATVQQTKDRAEQVARNAASLTRAAGEVASTREGVQLLLRAQAEAIMASSYNATALTTAISQQVRQQ